MTMTNNAAFAFTKGLEFTFRGYGFAVHKSFPEEGIVQAIRRTDGRVQPIAITDLHDEYAAGRLQILSLPAGASQPSPVTVVEQRSLDDYRPEVREAFIRQVAYVDGFSELRDTSRTTVAAVDRMIDEVAAVMHDLDPPPQSSLRRWVKNVDDHAGDRYALLPSLVQRRPAKGYDPMIIKRVVELLEQHYMSRQQPELKWVYETYIQPALLADANNDFDKVPSYSTVDRYLKKYLQAYTVCAKRKGNAAARMIFRSNTPTDLPTGILDQVELDFTPLDIWVVDDRRSVIMGRVQFCVIIDRFSRMPLGYSFSYGGESTSALLQCIKHAILPKSYVKALYPEIALDWVGHGVFKRLRVDNALATHSKALAEISVSLGFEVEFCPTKQPWLKGTVEAFLRKCARFVNNLPGATFSNFMKRSGYDPGKYAVMTLSDLEDALHRWMIDDYSVTFHSGLKRTPREAWDESAKSRPPALPVDPEVLNRVCGLPQIVSLSSSGIRLHSWLRYSSTKLNELRETSGSNIRVEIRWYETDLGYIYVRNPGTGKYFRVDENDQRFSSELSKKQNILVRRRSIQQHGKSAAYANRLKAKEELANSVNEIIAKGRPGGLPKASGSKAKIWASQRAPASTNGPEIASRIRAEDLADLGTLDFETFETTTVEE